MIKNSLLHPLLLLAAMLAHCATAAQDSHDLPVPAWGPYSNAYLGISHVADQHSGMRFDVSLFAGAAPTIAPTVPNASLDTGMLAWDAAPDLSYYAYRQRLDGRRVYAEFGYAALDEHSRVIRAQLHNASAQPRSIVLDLLASLQLPNRAPNAVLTPRRILRPQLPENAEWISALTYQHFASGKTHPRSRLVYDGRLAGEQRDDGMVDGRSLRLESGDRVQYLLPPNSGGRRLLVRYRTLGAAVSLQADGLTAATLDWQPGTAYQQALVQLTADARQFGLRHAGGGAVEIDGYALVDDARAAQVQFIAEDSNTQPEISAGPLPDTLVLKYRQLNQYYGVRWYRPGTRVREYRNSVLDGFFARNSMRRSAIVLEGDGKGQYTDLQFTPAMLAPGSTQTLWAVVTSGTMDQVQQALRTPQTQAVDAFERQRARATPPAALPEGQPYATARQLIRANLLMNMVYPVYVQGQYIRHLTPGKWWDSLYTWDSGFIGIGLAPIAPQLSAASLHAYTTAPGAQSAFIQHGTPLPVQHSQFLELWNQSQDRNLLEQAYPRLRQYYEFLIGRAEGSTTARLASGLLQSWDYFYNSGGWDDYPPQVRMHEGRMAARTAPMVTTAHVIRAAKILRMAALESGREDDAAVYAADIARLSTAIQHNAWDAASGYFGYVLHDGDGAPTGLLRFADGEMANMGLDGVQPLVAGITTPSQTASLIHNLTTPGRLWSTYGITAVDQRASYFNADGYWNGTVWMPHQWFIWKALLDQGESKLAWRVARTALDVYQHEAQQSWTSREHFDVRTGQGGGWHQFSGLSSPIASWFAAYFEPGRLTTGYDVWVRRSSFALQQRALSAELALYSERRQGRTTVLVTLQPGRYRASWNGKSVPVTALTSGTLSIDLPLDGQRSGVLEVKLR